MEKNILQIVDNITLTVYPDTHIPIYQVLSGFIFGLLFGSFHTCFIWTLLSYLTFEYLLFLSTYKRPWLYNWKYRVISILFSLCGIVFSKIIWGCLDIPIFRFIIEPKSRGCRFR